MHTLRSSLLALALTFGTTLGMGTLAAPASADVPAATASSFVDSKLKTLRALLGTPPSADREKKLDAELTALLDYDDMAKTALGEEYGKRSKEEIAEFTTILRQLIEKNYKKKLQETLNYEINNKGEEPKASDALVKTEAKSVKDKKAAPVMIDYVVRKKGATFIVVDIVVEDSPMVSRTYRKEFASTIKKDGWAGLIKKMKDKLAKS
jgi:ABC-type transporter MlaC component